MIALRRKPVLSPSQLVDALKRELAGQTHRLEAGRLRRQIADDGACRVFDQRFASSLVGERAGCAAEFLTRHREWAVTISH
jgi:hypothetical protein